MNIWLIILVGGLLTYAMRLSFILLMGKIEFPEWLRHSLSLVPPAVLSAIIFPELLFMDGRLDLSLDNNRLLAGLAAILVAWRTRNTLLTIAVGMAALLILQAVR
jgi:branched-subunit amino acid transport protein